VARSRVSQSLGIGEAIESGRSAAFNAMNARDGAASAEVASDRSVPGWARAMQSQASTRHHSQAALHTLSQGDRGGHGATPDLNERND
jgi:type IV secretion system protein TrbL